MAQPKEWYNCGGHALQTKTWYRPYESEEHGYDLWGYIGDMEEDGLEEEEILKNLTDVDIDCILGDFPNLEVVDYDKIDYARKVIAYRVMYQQYEGEYDFHFKYWNGKTWSEKKWVEAQFVTVSYFLMTSGIMAYFKTATMVRQFISNQREYKE